MITGTRSLARNCESLTKLLGTKKSLYKSAPNEMKKRVVYKLEAHQLTGQNEGSLLFIGAVQDGDFGGVVASFHQFPRIFGQQAFSAGNLNHRRRSTESQSASFSIFCL